MKIKKYGIDEVSECKEVSVWSCDNCDSYHIKAGNTILTFDKEEFSEFVNKTWNCFYDQKENMLALQ